MVLKDSYQEELVCFFTNRIMQLQFVNIASQQLRCVCVCVCVSFTMVHRGSHTGVVIASHYPPGESLQLIITCSMENIHFAFHPVRDPQDHGE